MCIFKYIHTRRRDTEGIYPIISYSLIKSKEIFCLYFTLQAFNTVKSYEISAAEDREGIHIHEGAGGGFSSTFIGIVTID